LQNYVKNLGRVVLKVLFLLTNVIGMSLEQQLVIEENFSKAFHKDSLRAISLKKILKFMKKH
jgi:hypothetical protein